MPSIFTRKKSTPSAATPAPPEEPATTSTSRAQSSASQQREGNGSAYVLPRRDSASIDQQRSQQRSPEKKNRSSFVKDREREGKDKRPRSPRTSKSFSAKSSSSRKDSDSHPLNLPPGELRRLSALSAARMGSSTDSERGESTEPMQESTPAPQSAPGAFPQTNGVNGDHAEDSPAPPPHRTPTSPPPQQEQQQKATPVDAEKCKEAGNKFFKAKQYDKAIEEYTKGWSRA